MSVHNGKIRIKANILLGQHGTLEIGPLNRLLNEAALFHLFDELVRVGSAGKPTRNVKSAWPFLI
jgi:hypothetical protein